VIQAVEPVTDMRIVNGQVTEEELAALVIALHLQGERSQQDATAAAPGIERPRAPRWRSEPGAPRWRSEGIRRSVRPRRPTR
jgi:hypothetical protein